VNENLVEEARLRYQGEVKLAVDFMELDFG
jgi:hypothetical protein